jgi:hypothetical protein
VSQWREAVEWQVCCERDIGQSDMTGLLEQAIIKVRELPEED